jgi:putative transposase
MAQFSQLFVHLVFAVKHRESLITPEVESRLYPYITGVVNKRKHALIAIGGTMDHIHILARLHPAQSISDLVRDIKTNSSHMINEAHLTPHRFAWQTAYGAFTNSKSQVPRVKRYILNQKEHHRQKTFKEEMMHILEELGIPHSDEYGFVWLAASS